VRPGHGPSRTAGWLAAVLAALALAAVAVSAARRGDGPPAPAPARHPATTAAAPAPACDLVASPDGSDSAAGTPADPFRTPRRLVAALAAGETGCLAPGTYAGRLTIAHGGTGDADRIVLTSLDPSRPATIAGRLYVRRGADYVTVSGLHLDGRNPAGLPSPIVDANHVTFSDDDVTNHNANAVCFIVGSNAGYGAGNHFLAVRDVVHNCGDMATRSQQSPDPETGFYEHAFYIENSTGFRITQTIMYAISNRCVQLYPDAVGGMVDHNLCDGAGTGVIVDAGSSGNEITRNIITGAVVQGGIAQGSTLQGTGNAADDNVLWDNNVNLYQVDGGLFEVSGVQTVDPMYTDASAHDYRLQAGSPAAGYGPDSIQPPG
jgi:hypothetical protein